MKTKNKTKNKLSLNKQTVAQLNKAQMNHIKGGSEDCPTISFTLSTFFCSFRTIRP